LGSGAGVANCCWNSLWNSTLYLKTQKGQEKGKIMTNSQFQLESKDINVWFGERQVLKDVSLQFPSNKVTALIGPSGCGKSTFIRTLNRMHELIPGAGLAGSVMLDGNDIYDESVDPTTVRLRVGMVFQKPNPFPTMSIKENVISGLRLSGRKNEISNDLVEESLKRASMWNESKDRLDEPALSLSGGQQQRLCIARSLAMNPEVLLMDEPCSALDPGSTRRIEETILELKESMTIVIVTHNMQQAQRVADKTAFFLADDNQPGHVVEFGETEQVFGMPVDPRTNDYVNGHFG
jgi:phosphate transport system ATP-binding protein